jgi:hypothetical protein
MSGKSEENGEGAVNAIHIRIVEAPEYLADLRSWQGCAFVGHHLRSHLEPVVGVWLDQDSKRSSNARYVTG